VFALVAVPVPLGRAFSYAIPEHLRGHVAAGARVLCEFGRRKLLGVVLELSDEPPAGLDPAKVKPLLGLLDDEPALPAELLRFLRELAEYYLAPIGEVLRLALPSVERSQVESAQDRELFDQAGVATVGAMQQVAVARGDVADPETERKLRGQAKELLTALREGGPQAITTLTERFTNARSAVKRLEQLGLALIERRAREADRFFSEAVERDVPKRLNEHQQAAVEALEDALATGASKSFLLEGVTGSGKTEVYLQVVEACLKLSGGVIVLVPEIALTPQLVARFRARFGDAIAVLHSGLSDVERSRMWRSLREGRVAIAIGARSALFAPVRDLKLICVDEEHDGSFKQEEGVRYNARDMAMLRAHRAGAVCVLGSATPSLSSEALVRKQRIERLILPQRAIVGAVLPDVEVVNLRNVGAGPSGNRLISLPLHRELERVLSEKRQAILFLNRRGFAPSLICEVCGTVAECPNCSVALTMHRTHGDQLRCHYCDFTSPSALPCTQCKMTRYALEGVGTERVEKALVDAFAGAKIARLDRDVASGLKSEAILDRMRAGEVDILVGTQMVTKGHDLPNVALVGVLNADAALSLPDYQASERTFSLIVQVAGRAGRAGTRGKVLIQTRNPEHPAILHACSHDTRAFVEYELSERREARYPPYYRLLMVRVDCADPGVAERTAQQLAAVARKVVGSAAEVLGPSAAPLARLKNRHRYRCILRSPKREPLYRAAHALGQVKVDARVRIALDVDPVSML